MKLSLNRLILSLVVLGWSSSIAHAALPVVSVSVTTFYLGNSVTITPWMADADADMDYATFAVSGPGTNGFQPIGGNVSVPGAGTSAQQSGVTVQQNWTPTLPGLWTLQVTVHSLNGTNSATCTFDVLAGTRTISPMVLTAGTSQLLSYEGELVTTTNTSARVVDAQSGSNLILWSGGRIKLEPGFHAQSGTYNGTGTMFWAAIDHNMDGYSDIEETQQNFVSGVPDAWLADMALTDSGIKLGHPLSTWSYTAAQLQTAYHNGVKPADAANATSTKVYSLVLATPSGFFAVKPDSWTITSVQ